MIYVRDEDDYAILKRAEDMLDSSFSWNINDDECTGWINEDELFIIDELCSKIDYLQEKIEDMEEKHQEEIRDFYKPKSPYEIYGLNERDF